MKQLEVFKKIGSIINELNEQYKYIEQNDPENINDLEIELFVANAHFLKDHADILNKLSQRAKAEQADAPLTPKPIQQLPPVVNPAPASPPVQTPVVEVIEAPVPPVKKNTDQVARALEKIKALTTEKFFEPVVVQQPKRDIKPVEPEAEEHAAVNFKADVPQDVPTFDKQPNDVIRHELVVDEDAVLDEDEDIAEEQLADEEVTVELKSEPAAAKPIEMPVVKAEYPEERIAIEIGKETVIQPAVEKPVTLEPKAEEPVKDKDEVYTINQRISAQLSGSHNNVSEQANLQPVTNLKQAITLNDKLLYIKDLFNGYSLAYSEAIEILNRFNSFEEANRFLNKNYTTKNNWDSKPETTEKFYALLKRRYS